MDKKQLITLIILSIVVAVTGTYIAISEPDTEYEVSITGVDGATEFQEDVYDTYEGDTVNVEFNLTANRTASTSVELLYGEQVVDKKTVEPNSTVGLNYTPSNASSNDLIVRVKNESMDGVDLNVFERNPCDGVTYDGSGTSTSPYIIEDRYQLLCVGEFDSDAHYLMRDVVTAIPIEPTGNKIAETFNGTLDGSFGGIDQAYIQDSLITENNGVIKNVEISRSNTYETESGAIVGENNGRIENLNISDISVEARGDTVGGLVGQNNGHIQDVYMEFGRINISENVNTIGSVIGSTSDGSTVRDVTVESTEIYDYNNGAKRTLDDVTVGGVIGVSHTNATIENIQFINSQNTQQTINDNIGKTANQ